MVNLRIKADGSLEKRCGYRLLRTFGGTVRAIWTGRLDGSFKGYVLVGSTVSLIDFSSNTLTAIGNIGTTSTEADFFYYRSRLYLVDGTAIYVISNGTVTTPHGYVPLRGKDWSDTLLGETLEPRNLLCNKGRITYVVREEYSSFLRLDSVVSHIDDIYINGTRISSTDYTLTSLGDTVSVSILSPGDRVTVCFTYPSIANSTDGLLSNTRATVFGGISNERPFLWNGQNSSVMYSSAFVSEKSLKESQIGFPQSDALYFPADHEFTVGDGSSPITAVSRHYDRLLIFTETGAWMADSSACGVEDHPVLSINSRAGVISRGAEARLGNQPCTVGETEIYRWLSTTDELDESNAYSISEPIKERLPKEFFENAHVFADTRRDELLFCSPALGDSIYVYQSARSAWVRFDGISADYFVDCGTDIGFMSGNSLYVFDEALTTDHGGKEIVGRLESNVIPLASGRRARLSSVAASVEGEDCRLDVRLDGEDTPSLSLPLGNEEKRLSAKRATSARLTLSTGGSQRQTIHSLSLRIG